jgi:colanic acid/amylovoran biosynthesis glycosyltransferase
MKIAFLVEQFPSLSETFILDQVIGLIERGHEVDIYARNPQPDLEVNFNTEGQNIQNRIYYHPYITGNYFIRLLKGIKLASSYIFKYPLPTLQALNVVKYGRRALSLKLLHQIVPFLNCGRPHYDIIYCHFGMNGIKGMHLRDLGVIQGKLCTVFHGFDLSAYLQEVGNSAYKSLFQSGDLFLPISDYWKQRLIELGCNEQKIIVHRMGIDVKQFTFNSRLPTTGVIRIITIARLVEKKGVEYGIRAIAQVKQHIPNIEYIIVGDGPLRNNLKDLINKLNLQECVQLLGWKQRGEVISLLNHCHILLAPSITSQTGDQEGIPVVLMEAMAMGVLVISTWHSGIPELVEDRISGFLVPEQNSSALAQKIIDLIKSPEYWEEIEFQGRLQIEENFNKSKLDDRLIEIFQGLLES